MQVLPSRSYCRHVSAVDVTHSLECRYDPFVPRDQPLNILSQFVAKLRATENDHHFGVYFPEPIPQRLQLGALSERSHVSLLGRDQIAGQITDHDFHIRRWIIEPVDDVEGKRDVVQNHVWRTAVRLALDQVDNGVDNFAIFQTFDQQPLVRWSIVVLRAHTIGKPQGVVRRVHDVVCMGCLQHSGRIS